MPVGRGYVHDFLLMPLRRDEADPFVILPKGICFQLVATAIHPSEVRYAVDHSCYDLLDRLEEAGVGQVSDLARPAVPLPKVRSLCAFSVAFPETAVCKQNSPRRSASRARRR